MIGQIVTGAVGGLVYSLSGLANKPAKEKFDWMKMTPTVIVAGVIGGVAGFTGNDFGLLINGATAAGATVIVEKFWKAIWSKINTTKKK